MFFDILTLFPDMFKSPFSRSIIGRARDEGIIDIDIIDIRNYTQNKHNVTDDYPYGGGPGMVLKIEPIYRAVNRINNKRSGDYPIILLSPQGEKLNQRKVKQLQKYDGLVLVCGRYEGFDERIRENIATEEISIGDYVLTGGELPAMVIVNAVARMIPSVLGDEASKEDDSFYQGLLSYPQYTRPREFKEMKVPDILLSGNHQKIDQWRQKQALKRTYLRRPELLKRLELNPDQKKLLKEIKNELKGENCGKN